MVYHGLNNMGPPVLNNLFTPYIPSRSLRSEAQFRIQVPPCKLVFTENDIAIRGGKYWNPINIDLKQCSNLDTFKRELKWRDASGLTQQQICHSSVNADPL